MTVISLLNYYFHTKSSFILNLLLYLSILFISLDTLFASTFGLAERQNFGQNQPTACSQVSSHSDKEEIYTKLEWNFMQQYGCAASLYKKITSPF